MTVMRWKWEDEETEENESNGICGPQSICVLARNIKEQEEEEGKGKRRTNEGVKNVCPAETLSTTYKRASMCV